jgi:hypothetical protein
VIHKTREERIGKIGEHIVANLLNCEISNDKYDMERDMTTLDGTQIEVKTQPRWKTANAFTVYETPTNNNIKKCLSVDCLIFVEPSKDRSFRIFECTDRTFTTRYPRGKTAYLFPVENMELLCEIYNDDLWEEIIHLTKTELYYLS